MTEPLTTEIPWTEWHGGECPLIDEEVEEWQWKLSDGTTHAGILDVYPPQGRKWNHLGNGLDIIAYRILKWREGCDDLKTGELPTPEVVTAEPCTPKVGDVVRLKSGGPKMTVRNYDLSDPLEVWCHWFDGNRSCLEMFPTATLQPA